MAEQLLGPPQSPADLDDDREVPTARVLDALRQLVNLGAAFLRDAAIVKEGLGQSSAEGRCKTGGQASSSVMQRRRRRSSAAEPGISARALPGHRCAADGLVH